MPNWAMGEVQITGLKAGVSAFAKRFICDDQSESGTRYFARSFTDTSEKALTESVEEFFKNAAVDEERTFCLDISFAWSAYSCLLDGYPQQFASQCITLSEACFEDHVSVEIRTSETGMCFEEFISCDSNGECVSTCESLKEYKCPECGETQCLASFEDPDEAECCECGCVGLDLVEIEKGAE